MNNSINRTFALWGAVALFLSVLLLFAIVFSLRSSSIFRPSPSITIGVLILDDFRKPTVAGLQDGFKSLEINNVAINLKNAGGDPDNLRTLAKELISEKSDYIFVVGGVELEEIAKINTDIPVIFADVNLPQRRGFNFPGVRNTYSEKIGERLSLAKVIFPSIKKFTVLTMASNITGLATAEEARKWAVNNKDRSLAIVDFKTADEIENFINNFDGNAGSIFLAPPAVIQQASARIIRAASKFGIPVVGFNEQMTSEGALFSYGEDRYSMGFAAANLFVRSTKDPPAPRVAEVISIEPILTVNIKTANKLGIKIGEEILIRAQNIVN